jgi:hypothetical protein
MRLIVNNQQVNEGSGIICCINDSLCSGGLRNKDPLSTPCWGRTARVWGCDGWSQLDLGLATLIDGNNALFDTYIFAIFYTGFSNYSRDQFVSFDNDKKELSKLSTEKYNSFDVN